VPADAAPAAPPRPAAVTASPTEPRSDRGRPRTPGWPGRALIGPGLATVALQGVLAAGDRLPSVDGLAYFEAGREILGGNGFTRNGAPELHFPPVTPVVLGVLEKLTGSELAALRTANVTTGLLVVALLVVLAHRIWHDARTTVATAWVAGTVAGLVPLFARHGGVSEALTLAFLLAGVLSVHAGARATPGRRALGAAGAGAAVGLAYLTRPESLLPGGLVGVGLVVVVLREGRGDGVAAFVRRGVVEVGPFALTLALALAPYVVYLHGHTGSWSPTAKTQDVSLAAWRGAAEDDRLTRDRELYAIDGTGTALGRETQSLTSLARQDPSGWAGIVGINLRTLGSVFLAPEADDLGPGWQVIPAFLLVPAAVETWRARRRRLTRLLVGMGAVPLVSCVAFFALPRYLVLTTAVLTLFAARGLARFVAARSRAVGAVAIGVTALALASSAYIDVRPFLPWEVNIDPTEQAAAGRWVDAHTPPDARIMTRSFHVQSYAHREVVALPAEDWPTTLAFARRMGVDYVVADQSSIRARRPELIDALLGPEAPPGLTLVERVDGRGRRVLIYRLDPPAPPSTEPPIYLGYVGD